MVSTFDQSPRAESNAMIRGHDESHDINNELKMLTLHLLFTDDAGDFDLEVNHGISNSDFASFNFATSGFSP